MSGNQNRKDDTKTFVFQINQNGILSPDASIIYRALKSNTDLEDKSQTFFSMNGSSLFIAPNKPYPYYGAIEIKDCIPVGSAAFAELFLRTFHGISKLKKQIQIPNELMDYKWLQRLAVYTNKNEIVSDAEKLLDEIRKKSGCEINSLFLKSLDLYKKDCKIGLPRVLKAEVLMKSTTYLSDGRFFLSECIDIASEWGMRTFSWT